MEDRRKRILVDEDDMEMRAIIGRTLRRLYDATLVANGSDALDEIRRRAPDLLLLDLRMPVMDGWEVLECLEADGHTLPVVVFSAEAQRPWPESRLVKARCHKLSGIDALIDACASALVGA